MRHRHTAEEEWARDQLVEHLGKFHESWTLDPRFTDAPDLVFENGEGVRAACEISGIPVNEWHRLKNDPREELDQGLLDLWVVPREADVWTERIVNSKAPKVPSYLKNANCTEAWLLIHGGHIAPYDLLNVDEAEGYDLPLMQKQLLSQEHPFRRVYAVSSSSKKVARVYPQIPWRQPAPDIDSPNVMKSVQLRSMKVTLGPGVTPVKIGSEFDPDRQRVLRPLRTT